MKILLIYIILFTQVCMSQQGWYKLELPTIHTIKDLSFYNENIGCIVGYKNTAFITSDGGISWNDLNLNQKLDLIDASYSSVSILNDSTIFIVGSGNVINKKDTVFKNLLLISHDKGINWKIVDYPHEEVIKICKCSNNTGFLFSTNGFISMTTNAGLTWKDTFKLGNYISYNHNYYDCWHDTAFIALKQIPNPIVPELLGFNNILTKKNGVYENWFSNGMVAYDSLDVRNVVAIGNGKYFVLAKDSLYWSFNEGKSWIRKSRDKAKEFWWAYTFKFFGELKGYMAEIYTKGSSTIIFGTIDGGITWNEQYMFNNDIGRIYSFSVVNDSVAYACGENGTVIKTTNAGLFPTLIEDDIIIENQIHPNPVSDNLWVSNLNSKFQPAVETKIEIFSAIGLRVLETQWQGKIDVSGLLPGVYFVRVGYKVNKFIKI